MGRGDDDDDDDDDERRGEDDGRVMGGGDDGAITCASRQKTSAPPSESISSCSGRPITRTCRQTQHRTRMASAILCQWWHAPGPSPAPAAKQ